MDKERFRRLADEVLREQRQAMGIGTLSERSVHAVLKRYYGNEAGIELPLAGFIADVLTDKKVIEIQTRNLRLLSRKLHAFLPLMPVTLVHPVAMRHRVVRIDLATGEIEKPKTLPRKGTVYEAFVELSSIRSLLSHPGLTVLIPLLIVDDIRVKKPNLKASKLVDRVPSDFVDEIEFSSKADYAKWIPEALEEPFTSESFSKAARIPRQFAQSFLLIADELQIVKRIGKTGNAWLYERW